MSVNRRVVGGCRTGDPAWGRPVRQPLGEEGTALQTAHSQSSVPAILGIGHGFSNFSDISPHETQPKT